MNNKIKIPVARLKQIIQEEVTRFYGLDDEDELSDEEIDEVMVTGASEQDKQAAITNIATSLKSASPDKAVAAAASAGVPIPNVKASR
jgi:response regulator of citrate/malate metabolism